MEFKVRKGLESDFLLYGLKLQYFYLFIGIGAGLVFFLVGDLLRLFNLGQMFLFFIHFIGSIVAYSFVWRVLKKISKRSKYSFRKNQTTISNRDIVKY
jgi:hypothetical protein